MRCAHLKDKAVLGTILDFFKHVLILFEEVTDCVVAVFMTLAK